MTSEVKEAIESLEVIGGRAFKKHTIHDTMKRTAVIARLIERLAAENAELRAKSEPPPEKAAPVEEAYASGFRWVLEPDNNWWALYSPSGKRKAVVSVCETPGGYYWNASDRPCFLGESPSGITIEQAKLTAEAMVLRWWRGFGAKGG